MKVSNRRLSQPPSIYSVHHPAMAANIPTAVTTFLENCGEYKERLTRLIEANDPECSLLENNDTLLAKHVMILAEWVGDKDHSMCEFLTQLVTPTLDLNVHPVGTEQLSQTIYRHCTLDATVQEALLFSHEEGVWFDPSSHRVYPQHKVLPEARALPGLCCSLSAHPSIFPVLQHCTKAEFSHTAHRWSEEQCGMKVRFFTAYMLQTGAQMARDVWTVDLDGASYSEHVTVSVNLPAGLPAELVDPSHSAVHRSQHPNIHPSLHRNDYTSKVRIPALEALQWVPTDVVSVVKAQAEWPTQYLLTGDHSSDTAWSHLAALLNDILYRGDVCMFVLVLRLHALMQCLTPAQEPTNIQVLQVLNLAQQVLVSYQHSAEFAYSEVQGCMLVALDALVTHLDTMKHCW